MRHLIFNALLLLLFNFLNSQTIVHPTKVVDCGGGISTAGDFMLQASIGQSNVQQMTAENFNLESGFIPSLRHLSGTFTTLGLEIASGWNMVSVPLLLSNYTKDAVFPTAVSSAYAYDNGYKVKDTLANGSGCWLKFPSEQTVFISGKTIINDTIDVNASWNMIGSISYPISIADIVPIPPVEIKSQFFGYGSSGYFPATIIQPGKAYWVKVNQAGKLILKTGSILKATSNLVSSKSISNSNMAEKNSNTEGMSILRFKDASGQERLLYYTTSYKEIDLEKYELPPVPPSEILDVRYKTQRNLEISKTNGSNENNYQIQVKGGKYPIDIELITDKEDKNIYTLEICYDNDENRKIQQYKLDKVNNRITISSELSFMKLIVTKSSSSPVPVEYKLYQNYPNPFNQSTVIMFDLPERSNVTMKVYNILGQEVATLVDGIYEAGKYDVKFPLQNNELEKFSSGVYYYNLQAGTFFSTGKLILIK